MAQKVTTMVIKVDLACEKCLKKIKKVLCDIPQIQNQIYDEKANTVTITVECCSPEKVKKKIYCKGGKTVKCIEIVKPQPPTGKPPRCPPPPRCPSPPPPRWPSPPSCPPPPPVCFWECYERIGWGPCWMGYGRAAGPCYYGGYGRPVYDSWGCSYDRGYYHPSRCTYYIYCEENPSACTIM